MTEMTPCATCGMVCDPAEYHPFAACLMFEGCGDGDAVRANLKAIRDDEREACAKVCEEIEEPAWYSYENPNSFYDGSGACAAAIRARGE